MKNEVVIAAVLLVIVALCQIGEVNSKEWVKKKHLTKPAEVKDKVKFYDTSANRKHNRKFAPSGLQCCKLGERIGRKKLSCNIADYHPEAVSGPGNKDRTREMVSQSSAVRILMKRLSSKVDSCVESKYAGNFKKCCTYKVTRGSELEACKRHLRRVDRKKCRKAVRKMFP